MALGTDHTCALAIGPWPRFRYDASGGGGWGESGEADGEGWCPLTFAPAALTIPPLDARTGRLLGVPLPPGLAIAIEPLELAGRWQPAAGAVELAFDARFQLLLLGRKVTPPLRVRSRLSCGEARGARQQARGRLLDGEGRGVLVGVAMVPPSGAAWLDRFLGLPGEALAVLGCRLVLCPNDR
ncbi:MAG: hypothetical protein VKK97_09255 [Synechococcaceae cyanobacterium]|nr:hypothetical protein [Synechococcaceae cyanobacterium]